MKGLSSMKRVLNRLQGKLHYPYRKTIYRKMIIFSLFAAIVPAVAVGMGSYLFSASSIQQEVNDANMRMLDNAAMSIDKTLQRVQDNATQMLLNTIFSMDAGAVKAKDYAGYYTTIDRYLTSLQFSNEEIGNVTLYLKEDGYLLSPEEGSKRVDERERALFEEEMQDNQRFIWTNKDFSLIRGIDPYGATLVSKIPLFSNKPNGLLFIHLKHEMFQEIFSRFTAFKGEQVYILNEAGSLISFANKEQVPDGLFETVRQADEVKRVSFKSDGTSYLVSPLQSPYSGWTYIDMVPVNELNARSQGIAVITISIVAIFILLSAILVLWGSSRAYRPIEKLVTFVKGGELNDPKLDEMEVVETRWNQLSHTAQELQNRVDEQLPIIRSSFALQLLQGHFLHYSNDQLSQMLRRYGLPDHGGHVVLVIASDLMEGADARFEEADHDLITFVIHNVAQYILEEWRLQGIVLHLLDDQIALWLWQDGPDVMDEIDEIEREVDHGQKIKAFAERVRTEIAGYLKRSVTIGMSDWTDAVAELPEQFQQACMAVRSRIIVGSNQVISHKGSMMNTDFPFRYPVEIEVHFEQALQLGDMEEAQRLLNEFAHLLRGALAVPELITMSYNQLATSTIRTAYLLGMQERQLFDGSASDPYAQIAKYHTLQELNEWIASRLAEPIVAFVHSKRNQESKRLIGKAVDFIETNYQFDLSLDQCAEVCGLSPHYLSKMFKKTMEVSFIEYLTSLRLENAKQLLRETELTVTDISEKVGYQPKNFIRVFKKQLGLTPGQYRALPDES
jgi:AraC-like DNA-binding protein